jgi:hypothetical protein
MSPKMLQSLWSTKSLLASLLLVVMVTSYRY